MLKHEFLLLEKVPEKISIANYVREDLIVVSDDFILENHIPIMQVRMYWESLTVLNEGINYYGTTIIDKDMAKELKERLCIYCKESEELTKFLSLLDRAIKENKFIIHFGV